MANNSIRQPFIIINDSDGTALENGNVYIGTAGLNPEINPISVYWDAGLTETAAQPIRTINGYFSRNGSPGALFTDAVDYSMTVRDEAGALVYTSLNSTAKLPFDAIGGSLESDQVAFLQSGTGATSRTVQDKLRDVVHAKDFDTSLASGDDWTAAIQEALNELESRGGGICQLPEGTLYLSISASVHINACLLVPDNVILQGVGMGATILQRLPAERGVDGVLIVNKYWDVNGVYTAAGNITMQDFTITDGATTPTRSNGDLIGIGHSDNVTIQRVESLNHDQHFVDICGSKRVKILNCVDHNQVVIAAASTIQIDGAFAGAIWGILDDGTITVEVEIANNNFKNEGADLLINLGHKQIVFEDINIHDNHLDGAYNANSSVISCDNNTSFKGYIIDSNIIVGNVESAKIVNIFIQGNSSESIDGFSFCNNIIKGSGRRAIYIGADATYAGSTFPNWTGLKVQNNNIDIECDSAGIIGIEIVGFDDSIVSGNSVILRQNTDTTHITHGIVIGTNRGCLVTNNIVDKFTSVLTLNVLSTGIYVIDNIAMSEPSSIIVSDNMIIADKLDVLLKHDNFNQYLDNIVFSKNRLTGAQNVAAAAYIEEDWAVSDGTNFRKQVDFGTDDFIQTLAAGTLYSGLLLPGKKTCSTPADISPAIIELVFNPTSDAAFATSVEDIGVVYISGTQIVGTQVSSVDVVAGTFDIVTGSDGVSALINTSTFQPLIRTTGYLKAWASI